jgi:hypothetical protein
VDVDPAGRDDLAGGVDLVFALADIGADGPDEAAINGDIAANAARRSRRR